MSTRLSTLVGSVVQAALTPHPVDRYLELVDPMITWRDLRAEIVGVRRTADRTVTLKKESWTVPATHESADGTIKVVPYEAGKVLEWKVSE